MHEYWAASSPKLFYHPSMEELAHRIQAHCESISPGPSQLTVNDNFRWRRFNDGFPDLFIENVRELADSDVIFLANLDTPEVVFEQLAMIYTIPRYLVRSFTVIMPYFPTGTMERVDTEGQICTAKILAGMLSRIPLSALGPCQIVIFDIHNLAERFYFDDHVIPRMESAIPLLIKRLRQLPNPDKVAVAFPDEGAHKRFSKLFASAGYETVICTKVRDGDRRIVKVKEGTCTGKHVVIVDDLVQSGQTLLQCAKALQEQEPTHISCFVTHAVFPKESWKKFLNPEGVTISYFWYTDSIPKTAAAVEGKAPFELISLAPGISEMLISYDLQRLTLRPTPRTSIESSASGPCFAVPRM